MMQCAPLCLVGINQDVVSEAFQPLTASIGVGGSCPGAGAAGGWRRRDAHNYKLSES